MEKKNLDWSNLTFGYTKTDKRFVANYTNGAWDNGSLVDDDKIVMSECAGVLQYAQTVFEGLKAYETKDGKIVTFRPDLTPYGTGATLYLRPYIFGINPVIGVKPAEDYQYRIFATPVGPYFKGGAKPIVVKISDFDRAAPHGTGNIKAGLNYAMSLHAIVTAHNEGFAENIYLDPQTRTKIEETGGANLIFTDGKGTLVVPKSNSILPSITRRSLVYVAEHYCGMKIDEREVTLEEVMGGAFTEGGLCGTAAVISPLGKINDHGKEFEFSNGMTEMGPVMTKLRETLTGIQMGTVEAPEGWIVEIEC